MTADSIRRWPLAAFLAFAATPGFATCPTGDDLAAGITLAQNTPFFMRSDFKATADGFIERRVINRGGQPQGATALYRHGLALVREHSASGQVEITYDDPLAPLDRLPETGSVSISGVALGADGDAPVTLDITYLRPGRRTLADCHYDVWEVNSRLSGADGTRGTTFRLDYAPGLGLVLAASAIAADGTQTPAFAFQWAGLTAELER